MTDSTAALRHKIASADDLKSVVRTMKAVAAASISQYENAVRALDDYYLTVQLGLLACFKQGQSFSPLLNRTTQAANSSVGAVVFGSDQGLVGQFNDLVSDYAATTLQYFSGTKILWAVGERLQLRLAEADFSPLQVFSVPSVISQITPLVTQILQALETQRTAGKIHQVYLFYNHLQSGAVYQPVQQRLLPPDAQWRQEITQRHWLTPHFPEIIGSPQDTYSGLMREYLFVSLFRACAESLASENASRLAAMQRAEKNIGELLEELNRDYHRLRQNAIDEELFDVIAGFEALTGKASVLQHRYLHKFKF